MKLIEKINITGTITLKTGLFIGGTNDSMQIGGLDKMVIKDPLTGLPYIPGSSIKGKLRSLVELKYGETDNGGPAKSNATHSVALFGSSADSNSHPSRLIVRDAFLNEECIENFKVKGVPFSESKTEVSIDRITAESNPRTFERVPAGAVFDLSMVLNVFDFPDSDLQSKKNLLATLKDAIGLLQNDYLGGQGSRGYGQIEINLDKELEQL